MEEKYGREIIGRKRRGSGVRRKMEGEELDEEEVK